MPENVIPVEIQNEMRQSYLTYAMSVIVSRALPDVRDGLKPVHRRILYAMYDTGLSPDKPTKKAGKLVGEVLGKYHPHGDQAVYNSIVRLAQDFSLRYRLVEGQGNFGSIDGDPPAAMRYTECRMTPLAMEMIRDINRDTVNFIANYDDTETEPEILPSGIPNLLMNGTSGIAVGMATNMPPHNIVEVINGIAAYIDNKDITIDGLLHYIKGPDFPTAGIIYGTQGFKEAYHTGRGRVVIRAKVEFERLVRGEDKKERDAIVIKELPYQVNKANLVIKISELMKAGKLEGVHRVMDESDRDGIRVVVLLKDSSMPQVVLNQLYLHTPMQSVFGIISLALVNKEPKILNLKELIYHYVEHRKEVVIRRTKHDLKKAEERAHILEGLLKALQNLDAVIQLIRTAEDVVTAKSQLQERFSFSEIQAQAILDLRLQRLTALEQDKILKEHEELVVKIKEYKEILASEDRQYGIVKSELLEIRDKYGDSRKTEIAEDEAVIDKEDLIAEEPNLITITRSGFIKRITTDTYSQQKRGGVGVSGGKTTDDDFIEHMISASTHDYLMLITSKGRAYYCKVYDIPEGSRVAKGKGIRFIFQMETDEEVKAYVPFHSFDEGGYVVMTTMNGVVKKSDIRDFVNAKTRGIIGINLDPGDLLVSAVLTNGNDELIFCSANGNGLRYHEKELRVIGRSARGVRAIRLKQGDKLLGMTKIVKDKTLLVVSERGYGKRTEFDKFMAHGRGTGGQIYVKLNEKSGPASAIASVDENEDVMIITKNGMIVRTHVSQVPLLGRQTTGVRVVRLRAKDMVVDIAPCEASTDEEVEDIPGETGDDGTSAETEE